MPKKQQQFDYSKPYRTRLGQLVTTVLFEDKNKILGVVTLKDGDGLLCEWSLTGLKSNLFPREIGEKHDLDLVNINV